MVDIRLFDRKNPIEHPYYRRAGRGGNNKTWVSWAGGIFWKWLNLYDSTSAHFVDYNDQKYRRHRIIIICVVSISAE